MKTLILLSGGIDSTVMLYYAVKQKCEPIGLSFDYGSNHNAQESAFRKYHINFLGIESYTFDLAPLFSNFKSALLSGGDSIPEGHYTDGVMKKTVVPFRNGIMIALAAGLAESVGAESIWLASHAGDHAIYPDCRSGFNSSMGRAISEGTYSKPRLYCPFESMSKSDIVFLGDKLTDLKKTYSCYKGGPIHCGRCSTCFERREAFVEAGVKDPTEYLDKTPFHQLKEEFSRGEK